MITAYKIHAGNNMKQFKSIDFSLGSYKYDNRPTQVTVPNFESFKDYILARKSHAKGQTYFCGGFEVGQHKDPRKYPQAAPYRLKKLAKMRAFAAFDFDGFSGQQTFQEVMQLLNKYQGFGYTTWSHTQLQPRARAILELDKAVNEIESQAICNEIEGQIERTVGKGNVVFDKSVYMLEQPIYGPPVNAQIFIFNGEAIDAELMALFGNFSVTSKRLKQTKAQTMTALLKKQPPIESAREVAKLKSMLLHIDADCEYQTYRQVVWAILSTNWLCAEQIALDWSLTAPDRFNQTVFDYLVNNFDINRMDCPSLGSINFLAKEGGWNE
jgi:hypothetical protein